MNDFLWEGFSFFSGCSDINSGSFRHLNELKLILGFEDLRSFDLLLQPISLFKIVVRTCILDLRVKR